MLKICNIKDKLDYVKEVSILTLKEWGKDVNENNFDQRVNKKINKILSNINQKNYVKLVLLDDDILIGFISIFPNDCDELDITPWYSTMYVKKEYRKQGYSKILHKAIIEEAKKMNIKRLYLKTDLNNYYEKFGAVYMNKLNDLDKLYYIDIEG